MTISLDQINITIPTAQLSFNKDANLEVIKNQLSYIKEKYPDYRFVVGFLARKHVEEKDFDPAIVNLLETELEGKIIFATSIYDTFAEVTNNLPDIRQTIKNLTSKLFVLDSGINPGVAQEIEFQSDGRIVIII
jgi:hypothetical protein